MINKIIEQQETIKGMQENEESAIKIMKMYEDYKLRVDKATEYIEDYQKTIEEGIKKGAEYTYLGSPLNKINKLLEILKGEDKE